MSELIRKATWLELFFDLIFVVAIAKAAHVLQHAHHGHLAFDNYFKYTLIMIPLWWAWVGCTMFANRFDCDDVPQRLMSFAQMFAAVVLASFISADFDPHYKGFLLSYAAVRVLTVFMYLRASAHEKKTRSVSNFLAAAFGAGILISLSSLFFEPPWRYVVLYAGIVFEIFMPLLNKKRLKAVPVHAHHLPERFGLLTIVLLGESVLSLAASFEEIAWSPLSLSMAVCGFMLTCSIWWVYFENLDRSIMGRDLGHAHGIIYPHFFIYLGLGGIAAVVRFAVVPDLALTDYKILSVLSVLVFALALQFLHFIYHPKDCRRILIRNAALFNGVVLVFAFFAPSAAVLMGGITALFILYALPKARA